MKKKNYNLYRFHFTVSIQVEYQRTLRQIISRHTEGTSPRLLSGTASAVLHKFLCYKTKVCWLPFLFTISCISYSVKKSNKTRRKQKVTKLNASITVQVSSVTARRTLVAEMCTFSDQLWVISHQCSPSLHWSACRWCLFRIKLNEGVKFAASEKFHISHES